jgi:hypothetical protein
MAHHRFTTGMLVFMSLGLLLAGCKSSAPPAAPDALQSLEAAVRAEIEAQVSGQLDSELREYEVRASELLGEGNFGRVEAMVVLEVCPLFQYDLYYNAELKDGQWVLYTDEDTMPNLFKRWATARSAALAGETVDVPGSEGHRHVFLLPDGMPELLQARLDGLSNPTMDPLVGFFVCAEDEIRWEDLDQVLADDLRTLLPLVREAMSGGVVEQIRE